MIGFKLLFSAAALCVSAIAVTAAAGPAQAKDVTVRAAPPEDVTEVVVDIADLRLASADDQKVLRRRVAGAVTHVCAPSNEGPMSRSYTKCIASAWDGARPQMTRAMVAAQQLAEAGGTGAAVAAITVSAGITR